MKEISLQQESIENSKSWFMKVNVAIRSARSLCSFSVSRGNYFTLFRAAFDYHERSGGEWLRAKKFVHLKKKLVGCLHEAQKLFSKQMNGVDLVFLLYIQQYQGHWTYRLLFNVFQFA